MISRIEIYILQITSISPFRKIQISILQIISIFPFPSQSTHLQFAKWKYANDLLNRNLYYLRQNFSETQENERAWVSYIFLANMISHLETCCDTFYVHFRSLRCRVTHSSYSSTTYIDYTLQTAQLQRQLTFQITFALYGLKEALSYSRR